MWTEYDPPRHRDAVSRLFDEVERVDGVPALTEHKMIRLGAEGHQVVVLDDAAVIAYGQAAWHPSATEPAGGRWSLEVVALDQGAGAKVLDALAIRLGSAPYTVWAWTDRMRAVLASARYREVRRLYRLERSLPLLESPSVPNGVELERFRPGHDESAWVEANNEAFDGHPENGRLTVDDVQRRMNQDWFDPDGLLMAWEGDRLLGSCWTKRHPESVGEIYIIGVRPAARGRGLGRALVVAGLDDLHRRQGCSVGMLYVDGENAAALWLYTDLGFDSVFVNVEHEPPPG